MRIDLNADVGEGVGEDAALIPLVTSVNIACGGHAGDADVMARSVALALASGASIGAHPGYPDREGFGRRDMDMSAEDLEASLLSQLRALEAVVRASGATLRHVKPHGALYNRAARDLAVAEVVADAVSRFNPFLVLVGLAGSKSIEAGRAAGLTVAAEGFADRLYEPDGSLRSRGFPDAILATPEAAAGQAVAIATMGTVTARGGANIEVRADTLCIHSDTPNAVEYARSIRAALDAANVRVADVGSDRRSITRYGDSALLVSFEQRIDPAVNAQVHELAQLVTADRASGSPWTEPIPAYASLLVPFDPLHIEYDEAEERLLRMIGQLSTAGTKVDSRPVLEIPVRYGGEDGPDLADVAERTGLTTAQVIDLHSRTVYRAYMLGFAPGFAYLGSLPEALWLPRRSTPRQRVPAGSVAIAAAQTAVYPHATPGGWHLIGRTALVIWDAQRDPPALIEAGRDIRFVPIND